MAKDMTLYKPLQPCRIPKTNSGYLDCDRHSMIQHQMVVTFYLNVAANYAYIVVHRQHSTEYYFISVGCEKFMI